MPRPTTAQLRKINQFSQTELKDDQVYVFRSLSADTLPVARYSWFGEYSINMTEKLLQKLKKDYRRGVGLLASHDSYRLPFGRTFDAEILSDEVAGSDEAVKTLYIDHYMVTHKEDENGTKLTLPTELGMTTQDIANHIDVGHTFDTSIGFKMHDPKCSICKNSIRDYDLCDHVPGVTYKVDGEEVRCNIVAEDGEGIENSLVYAGAVGRAIIQNRQEDGENFQLSTELQPAVKFGEVELYNVDDIKNLPPTAGILCFMARGNMQLYTDTKFRRDFSKHKKGSVKMAEQNPDTSVISMAAAPLAETVLKSDHEAALAAKDAEIKLAKDRAVELEGQLQAANASVVELTAKAALADEYKADLISATIKAGVASRGNAFSAERYQKYLENLGVDEIKLELEAMQAEFAGTVQEAALQVTEAPAPTAPEGGAAVVMSEGEMREAAARQAALQYNKSGGDLTQMTNDALAELRAKNQK